jgi:hypothetical protein
MHANAAPQKHGERREVFGMAAIRSSLKLSCDSSTQRTFGMADESPFPAPTMGLRINPYAEGMAWLTRSLGSQDAASDGEDARLLLSFHKTLSQVFPILQEQINEEFDGGSVEFHGAPAVRAMDLLLSAAQGNRDLLRKLRTRQAAWLAEGAFSFTGDTHGKSITIVSAKLAAHSPDVAAVVAASEEAVDLLAVEAGWSNFSKTTMKLISTLETQLKQLSEAGQVPPPCASRAAAAAAAPHRVPNIVRVHAALTAVENAAVAATLRTAGRRRQASAFTSSLGEVHETCSLAAADARILILGVDAGAAEAIAAGHRLRATFEGGAFLTSALRATRGILELGAPASAAAAAASPLQRFFDVHTGAIDDALPLHAALEHLSRCWDADFEDGLRSILGSPEGSRGPTPACSATELEGAQAALSSRHPQAEAGVMTGASSSGRHLEEHAVSSKISLLACQHCRCATQSCGSKAARLQPAMPRAAERLRSWLRSHSCSSRTSSRQLHR